MRSQSLTAYAVRRTHGLRSSSSHSGYSMSDLTVVAPLIIAAPVIGFWVFGLENVEREFVEYGLPTVIRNFGGATKTALLMLAPAVLFTLLEWVPGGGSTFWIAASSRKRNASESKTCRQKYRKPGHDRPGFLLPHAYPIIQSGRRDSNPRHQAWKASALPTELLPRLLSLSAPLPPDKRPRSTRHQSAAPTTHLPTPQRPRHPETGSRGRHTACAVSQWLRPFSGGCRRRHQD
jgi:hypothetical protein